MLVHKGDVLLVPPGVAHKQISEEGRFSLLGSYPTHRFDGSIDTCRGEPTNEERRRIHECYVPKKDPIFNLNISKLCSSPVESD